MKKLFTYLLAIAALSAMVLSCSEDEKHLSGEPDADGCYNVYFPTQNTTGLEIDPADPKELTITALRENTYGAITVPLEISNDYDGVLLLGELTFADGQTESEVTIYYEGAEIGVEYSFAVQVSDPQYGSYYSSNLPGIDVSLCVVKWNSLTDTEKARYTDDIFTTFWTVENLTWDVDVQERDDMPGLFRVVYPYDGKYYYNGPGKWDTSKTYYMKIDATDPEGVFMEQQEIGVDWGYGMISIMSDGYYYYIHNYTWDEIKQAGYCGTFKNGIITFPEKGILINMPLYDATNWYYANLHGAFKLVLPGAIEADYSIGVNNVVVDNMDVTATVTLGDDVESARVGIYEGDDINSAVSAIKRGSGIYTTINESGDVSFTCTSGGKWSIVAVSYGEGEAQESAYATAKIVDPDETWSLYGTGNYEYSIFFNGIDTNLEIYQSNSDQERFKIKDWCYADEFIFTWDQTTNKVVVEDQSTGYTYSRYGLVYVNDLSDYYGIGSGVYSDGTFYFALAYYLESMGIYGVGSETFTLSGGDMFTLNDLLGTYSVDGVSYFGSTNDVSGYPWVIEASDDPDWDIMLTYFNGWKCTSPLYGTFDTSTGVFSIYSGTTGQYFYNFMGVYDIYFGSYNAFYYSMYGYDSGMFQLLPNGTFIGPLEADMVGEYMYLHGTSTDFDWNQIFEFVCGTKVSTSSYSVSADESRNEVKVISNKIDYTPLPRVKVKFEKSAVTKETKTTSLGETDSFPQFRGEDSDFGKYKFKMQ